MADYKGFHPKELKHQPDLFEEENMPENKEGIAAPLCADLKVHILPHGPKELPRYGTSKSAGFDLEAAIDSPITIPIGCRVAVPTGLVFGIPEGHELQIRSRSGLSLKHGLIVMNAPGTIDEDYTGEVMVILGNQGDVVTEEPFIIKPGMRIAQAVLAPVTRARMHRVEMSEIEKTDRGAGGFGSTGI